MDQFKKEIGTKKKLNLWQWGNGEFFLKFLLQFMNGLKSLLKNTSLEIELILTVKKLKINYITQINYKMKKYLNKMF
jgi:hypothetical protein